MSYDPFTGPAASTFKAHQIINQLVVEDRDYSCRDKLLLWKAYVKRIRPVPETVMADAVTAFQQAAAWSDTALVSVEESQAVMDRLGDLVWEGLLPEGRREWLLKVV